MVAPRLTTVYQPAYDMGRRAAELVVQLINNDQPTTPQVVLPTELRIRETTGRAR
jgi:DNA-binding LacI/PurR family transcriptional regulator